MSTQRARYEILFLKSIHLVTNIPIESSQALYGYNPDDFKKTLDIEISHMDKSSEESMAFFENELQFAWQQKSRRGCRHIPNYYFEEKLIYNDESYDKIMQDAYPFNLKQYL